MRSPCLVLFALYAGATSAFVLNPRPIFLRPPRAAARHVGRLVCGATMDRNWRQEYGDEPLPGTDTPIKAKRQPEGPLEDDPSLPMIQDIIRAMDERKADGVWAARVAHLTYSTSFYVNCQGTSRPMLQAVAANIEDTMSEKYDREIKWQGNPDSGWILLDYGEVICNIMTQEAREFYRIENLWAYGEEIPLDGLVTPDSAGAFGGSSGFDDEDWGSADPFADWDAVPDDDVDGREGGAGEDGGGDEKRQRAGRWKGLR